MKLNVLERVVLLGILPGEGDFTTLKILRELRDSLGFSEKEYKKFNLETKENQVTWDPVEGAKDVEIEIGETARDIIKDALVKMDQDKKLEEKHFSVYEKFVQDKGGDK